MLPGSRQNLESFLTSRRQPKGFRENRGAGSDTGSMTPKETIAPSEAAEAIGKQQRQPESRVESYSNASGIEKEVAKTPRRSRRSASLTFCWWPRSRRAPRSRSSFGPAAICVTAA